jgi:hypothetical protein
MVGGGRVETVNGWSSGFSLPANKLKLELQREFPLHAAAKTI